MYSLDMETAGTVRVEDISSGTKQAMITTIVGLIVGIIAYMAYNNLVSKVSQGGAQDGGDEH